MIPIEINAFTVCINYGHYLKRCLPNRKFFKRWIIVTHENDLETINICKENNLEYILSKTVYNRQFAKGCAINEAINYIGLDEEWYLHIDADVLLPDNFSNTFTINEETKEINIIGLKRLRCVDVDRLEKIGPYQIYEQPIEEILPGLPLFSMGRINVDQNEDFQNFDPQKYFNKSEEVIQEFKGYGYFQLWHMPSLLFTYPDLNYVYPQMSNNAGHDDFIFSKMFYQIISLDLYCLHLSPEGVFWDGV